MGVDEAACLDAVWVAEWQLPFFFLQVGQTFHELRYFNFVASPLDHFWVMVAVKLQTGCQDHDRSFAWIKSADQAGRMGG